ncbi:MAG TPA: pyridoxamine 5'-phosphate oxidase [Thermomicrobiaceae bacterium]|nr:pyridoxamine 5'-phosphate oxidase [Thermomicrobiaceae bacterium]
MADFGETNDALIRLRKEHALTGLSEGDLDRDPFRQFEGWLREAMDNHVNEANAMVLATATPDGRPSARVVLLRGFDERGLTFYSNYDSRKGQELADNPHVAAVFHWADLGRQVRVEGSVARVGHAESEAYFHSRPVGSQLGSWASRQSRAIAGREVLEERLRELEREYPDGSVPLPPFWGGFRVTPAVFEFWQGRPSRLHDRFRYARLPEGAGWRIERLSP